MPDDATFLQRWERLAERDLRLPQAIARQAADAMLSHYGEATRHYHGTGHIVAMLADFDRVKEELQNPVAMELAIFFHDLIYDAARSDNEAVSAAAMREMLGDHLPAELLNPAIHAIEATRSHAATGSPDTDLLIDLDMAVLGGDWPSYLKYARGVMREYVPVYGEAAYRQGRVSRFLEPVIASGAIYLTPRFQSLTGQALDNLRRERDLHLSSLPLA